MNIENNVMKATGKVRDKVYVDGELVEDTGFRDNVIVSDINKLICALLSQQNPSTHTGLTYWAVGSGEADWDTDNPPSANSDDSLLADEVGRIAIDASNFSYLDSSNNETSEITNRLELNVVFDEDDANGDWLELGIFGGDADGSINSGIMINHLTHSLIEKRDNMTVERTLRFNFE